MRARRPAGHQRRPTEALLRLVHPHCWQLEPCGRWLQSHRGWLLIWQPASARRTLEQNGREGHTHPSEIERTSDPLRGERTSSFHCTTRRVAACLEESSLASVFHGELDQPPAGGEEGEEQCLSCMLTVSVHRLGWSASFPPLFVRCCVCLCGRTVRPETASVTIRPAGQPLALSPAIHPRSPAHRRVHATGRCPPHCELDLPAESGGAWCKSPEASRWPRDGQR